MIEGDLFKSLFDVIPFDIYVVDVVSYEIIYMNRKMIESRGNFIGERCFERIYGEEKPCYFCKIPQLIDGTTSRPLDKTITFDLFNPMDDRWYQMQEKAMTWPDGRITKYSIAVDISELKETQNRLAEAHAQLALKNKALERLSITDNLTGLFNRLHIEDVLENVLYSSRRYGHPSSIIMIDIDHFKQVNDTWGHLVGDEVLVQVSDIFRRSMRKSDVPGRWGGEEFLIVCQDTDEDNSYLMAEKICHQVANAEFPSAKAITISAGVAGFREGDDRVKIIQRSDSALYRAKELGRNRVER